MSYKVTINGEIVLQECIESISFEVDPPPDDFSTWRSHTISSMRIKGKVGTHEDATGICDWAQVTAIDPKCFKKLEVEHTKANQLIRKISFSKAFVISYSEKYTDDTGVGHFELHVRQQLASIDIECTNGQSTVQTPSKENLLNEIFETRIANPALLVPQMPDHPDKYAEAGKILKEGLDDYYNAFKSGEIKYIDPSTGKDFKTNTIAAALDVETPQASNISIGFNGAMSKYNPSVDADFSVIAPNDLNKAGKTDYLVKAYSDHRLKALYDNKSIDDLFEKNADYYKSLGITKEEVIKEMDKFRGMLRKTNKYVEEHPDKIPIKDVYGNIVGFSLTGWKVENCAEVWATRNAILKGAKVDNIVLRSIEYDKGTSKELCKQCKITFEEFINSKRIISD